MLSKGILKRVLPFLLTFAAGIFLASFFVSVALPTIKRVDRGPRRFSECKRMHSEMDRLRDENQRMRRDLEFHNIGPSHLDIPDVPPVVLDVPAPPASPRAPRFR
jgi:hypothetical protein